MADEMTGTATGVAAPTDAAGIRQAIREFVRMNFLFDGSEGELDDYTSFMEEGIVDSTGVLELVLFVEESWGLTVDHEDLLPENFDSVDALASYVERRLAAA
ncbi:MAG: hypothetical protein PVSMB4_14630 [Ktedonobacterales bacterium]